MEINPVRPVRFDPEQSRGPVANRQTAVAHHFARPPIIDEVGEFSLNVLLKLADAALAGGNSATALEQYLKVLQYEPNNIQALYGKILAEGSQSPDNLNGVLVKLDVFLKTLPDAEKARMLNQAGRDIVALGQKVESDALATFLREITPVSYQAFADRMEQALVLYQNAAAQMPSHEAMLLAMITAAERLMVPYRDRKTGWKFHPSKVTYEKGKNWLQNARELLKKRFPNRFDRLLLYKKYQTCFVATAAWGDPMADEVVAFRTFRDLYLRTNPVGRRFIVLYYRHGATAAGMIAGSRFLRRTVRGMLMPVLWVVRRLPGIRERRY